jgi:hypothetical protein
MNMRAINILLSFSALTLISVSQLATASSCSKADVDHYLKSGFTHDQVVKLCTEASSSRSSGSLYQSISKPAQPTSAPIASGNATTTTVSTVSRGGRSEDQVYFETVIEGSPVTLSNDKLIFERKECAVYGELDMTQTRDKACVNTRTTINLKGLEVIRATKGIVLLKPQELIVKGSITREYLNISRLNKYQSAAVKEQLPINPGKFNIPVKKGIDPNTVAGKLKKYK